MIPKNAIASILFFGISPRPIKWLHRTARDYIEHPLKWNELVALTARTHFNPAASLSRSCVDLLEFDRVEIEPKLQDDDSRRRFGDHVWFLSNAALIYALHNDYQTRNPQCILLDRLSVLLSNPYRGGGDPYLQHSDRWKQQYSGTPLCRAIANADIREFLSLAVMYGLVAYVREKVRHKYSSHHIETSYASMLQYIPRATAGTSGRNYPPPRFEMVELLLQLGADPNVQYNGPSVWEKALYELSRFTHISSGCEYASDYLR
jgi:hypothetical protein